MTVPDRTAAGRLLQSLNPPEWSLRHARGVAEVAAWLAARGVAAGCSLDRSLVEASALLHDVDKLLPRDDPARRLPHGAGSAAWLAERGHPELAEPVQSHPVTRLADDAWWEAWSASASLEAQIVAYADKRVGQRLVTMEARFADWERRYPTTERGGRAGAWSVNTVRRVRERARELERRVTLVVGVEPHQVRRRRWTASALRTAR